MSKIQAKLLETFEGNFEGLPEDCEIFTTYLNNFMIKCPDQVVVYGDVKPTQHNTFIKSLGSKTF
jgi:hypothetical protein